MRSSRGMGQRKRDRWVSWVAVLPRAAKAAGEADPDMGP